MQSSEFGGIYQSREFAEDLRTAALPFSIITQGYVNTLKVFIDFFWKYQKKRQKYFCANHCISIPTQTFLAQNIYFVVLCSTLKSSVNDLLQYPLKTSKNLMVF